MGIAQYRADVVLNDLNSGVRQNYFANIGVNVQNAQDLETAINLSGLNFNVVKRPMGFYQEVVDAETGVVEKLWTEFKDQYVTVREDTNEPLGSVGKNYSPLQNRESFDFLQDIVNSGAKFETAGTYGNGGAKSFITMKADPITILDDEVANYLCILNSHDGSGSVRLIYTPTRVFCSNCLALALKTATNKLSIRHSKSLTDRMNNAKLTLTQNTKYLGELKKEAEQLAVKDFPTTEFTKLVAEMYPILETDSDVVKERQNMLRGQMLKAYAQDDLANFGHSGWRAVNAVADAESHQMVFRKTKNSAFANFNAVMDGMVQTNQVLQRVRDYV